MSIFVTNSLVQGTESAFMVLGVLLTFNFMGFPDMTVQGSFPLGAAVVARLMITGTSPILGTLIAIIAGCLAGVATGIIHTKFRVNPILAGILTSTALYSVMLIIMTQPDISLLNVRDLFAVLLGWFGGSETNTSTIVVAGVLLVLTSAGLFWFLKTDLGLAVRAVGSNERMIRGLGVNTDGIKILALGISNGLVAASGAAVGQTQGFADVGMGIGALIAAVASLILGQTLLGHASVGRWIVAATVGSILYQAILNLALRSGFSAVDFQLISSLIILVAVGIPVIRSSARDKLNRRAAGSGRLLWSALGRKRDELA